MTLIFLSSLPLLVNIASSHRIATLTWFYSLKLLAHHYSKLLKHKGFLDILQIQTLIVDSVENVQVWVRSLFIRLGTVHRKLDLLNTHIQIVLDLLWIQMVHHTFILNMTNHSRIGILLSMALHYNFRYGTCAQVCPIPDSFHNDIVHSSGGTNPKMWNFRGICNFQKSFKT